MRLYGELSLLPLPSITLHYISLACGEIKICNSKYSFYWLSIAFVPLKNPKLVNWHTIYAKEHLRCGIVSVESDSSIRLCYSISALDLSLIYSENQDIDIRGQKAGLLLVFYFFAFKATSCWYDLSGGPCFFGSIFCSSLCRLYRIQYCLFCVFCVHIVEHVCYLPHPQ